MMGMVAQELQARKPGGEFARRIQEAISLRKTGRALEARHVYSAAIDSLLALQRQGEFEDAVESHERMVDAVKADGTYGDMWWDSYSQLAPSYTAAGESLKLAEGVLSGLPSSPTPENAGGFANLLLVATRAFLDAGETERARRQADRLLEVAEMLNGSADFRWYRNEALEQLRLIALNRNDRELAGEVLGSIYENLRDAEKDLSEVCPAARSREQAHDEALSTWFRRLGDAYHNLGHHCAFWGWGDNAEALRLLRRAAELREFAPTEIFVARLTLSVEGDTAAALGHLRKAAKHDEWREVLRRELDTSPEFAPFRQDPEFKALLSE